MKIAIIGAGGAGLMAGMKLEEQGYDVTIFEKEDYIGGHVLSLSVPFGSNDQITVDIGNTVLHPTFPGSILSELLKECPVPIEQFTLDFSYENTKHGLFWSTHYPYGNMFRKTAIFFNALREALKRGRVWKTACVLRDVHRFLGSLKKVISDPKYLHMNVGEFCEIEGYSQAFIDTWLAPQLYCWWGVKEKAVFLANIYTIAADIYIYAVCPQYRFKEGWGSFIESYFKPIFPKVQKNASVERVERKGSQVEVVVNGQKQSFDGVVFATYPNVTAELLQNKSSEEARILGDFECHEEIMYLHRDTSWLPKQGKWGASNLIQNERGSFATTWLGYTHPQKPHVFLTWIDVSANGEIPKDVILAKKFTVVLSTGRYPYACREISSIQGGGNVWHSGAHVHALGEKPPSLWFDNALLSGVAAAEMVMKSLPLQAAR